MNDITMDNVTYIDSIMTATSQEDITDMDSQTTGEVTPRAFYTEQPARSPEVAFSTSPSYLTEEFPTTGETFSSQGPMNFSVSNFYTTEMEGTEEGTAAHVRENTSTPPWWWNSTTTASQVPPMDLIGMTDLEFNLVHSVAVACLLVGLSVSVGILIFLWHTGDGRAIYRRRVGERLVFYMAVCDMLYSIEHIIDHGYLLFYREFPPGVFCDILGFFLQEFACMQAIIITFTALNAFSLIVREKALPTGKHDWRILVAAVVIPAILGGIFLSLDLLGPDQAWCLADKTKELALYVNMVYSGSFALVFVIILTCYALVIHKIRAIRAGLKASTSDSAQSGGSQSNIRAALIMCTFIIAYIVQWASYMVYTVWSLFMRPPAYVFIWTTLTVNLGGLLNGLAYTFVRRIGKKKPLSGSTSQSSTVSIR